MNVAHLLRIPTASQRQQHSPTKNPQIRAMLSIIAVTGGRL